MAILDIIIIVLLLFAAYRGFSRGFVTEVLSIIGFFLGILLAMKLTPIIMSGYLDDVDFPKVVGVLVFIGIMALTSVAIHLVARIIQKTLSLIFLGGIDKALGAVFAFLKWGFILSLVFWAFGSMDISLPESVTEDSRIYKPLASIAPSFIKMLGNMIPEFNTILDKLPGVGGIQT